MIKAGSNTIGNAIIGSSAIMKAYYRGYLVYYKAPEQYIVFADPVVGQICATNWGDGTGIKPSQAAKVTNAQLGTTFRGNTEITSFDELHYFTGVSILTTYSFRGCTALRSIILPPGLITLGDSVFRDCSALTAIEIPNTVTSIANACFYNTSSLANVILRPTTPPSLPAVNTFQGTGGGIKKLLVPWSEDGSILAAYKSTSRWSDNIYINRIYELNPDGTIPT